MDAPLAPRLLDRVRDRIRVKHYSIRTEQAYVDWIRRFIHLHGKRHPSGVEIYLTRLDRMSDCSLVADGHRPMTAMEGNALCPQVVGLRPSRSPTATCTARLNLVLLCDLNRAPTL